MGIVSDRKRPLSSTVLRIESVPAYPSFECHEWPAMNPPGETVTRPPPRKPWLAEYDSFPVRKRNRICHRGRHSKPVLTMGPLHRLWPGSGLIRPGLRPAQLPANLQMSISHLPSSHRPSYWMPDQSLSRTVIRHDASIQALPMAPWKNRETTRGCPYARGAPPKLVSRSCLFP